MTGAVVLTVSVGDAEELNEELVVLVVITVVTKAACEVPLAGVKDAQSLVRVEDTTTVDPGFAALLVNEETAEVSELLVVIVLLVSAELLDVEEREVDIVLDPPEEPVSVEEDPWEVVDIAVPELHIDEVEWLTELVLLSEEVVADIAVCDVVLDLEDSELVSVEKEVVDVATVEKEAVDVAILESDIQMVEELSELVLVGEAMVCDVLLELEDSEALESVGKEAVDIVTLEPDIEVAEELSELVLLGEERVIDVAVCDENPELREPEIIATDEEDVVIVAVLELDVDEGVLIEGVLAEERVSETRVCDGELELVVLPEAVPDD